MEEKNEVEKILKQKDDIIKVIGNYGYDSKTLASQFGISEDFAKLLNKVYDKGFSEYSSKYWGAFDELQKLRKQIGSVAAKLLNEVYKED